MSLSIPSWAITVGAVATLLAGVTLIVASCPSPRAPSSNDRSAFQRDQGSSTRLSGQQLRPAWLEPLPIPPAGSSLVRAEDFPAGVRLRVRDDSAMASDTRPIYVAHSRNNWNPTGTRMALSDDGLWEVMILQDTQQLPLEYKLTLGSWNHCEVDPGGFSVSNRTLPFIDAGKQNRDAVVNVEVSVARFLRDGETENLARGWTPRVVSGSVKAITLTGGGGRAQNLTRDVWVWLPPRYDDPANADRNYPVLIMLDGQAMFERPPNSQAEWQMDETASRLIANGSIEPFICIAIPHSGGFRFDEYLTTTINPQDVPDSYMFADALRDASNTGDQFVQYLINSVLPAARQHWRITRNPAQVGIGGGDLAASLAYYAASRYPDSFGMALCEDPWVPINEEASERYMHELTAGHPTPRVLYYGFGDLIAVEQRILGVVNTDDIVSQIEVSKAILSQATSQPDSMRINFKRGTGSGITWWAQRLPEALQTLFPASGTPKQAPIE